MANTFFGLTIGRTGMNAATIGLNTTSHNIANEQTTGYSRQTVSQQAMRALRVYQKYGMVGTGVDVTAIEQVRDVYYDNKYWNNNAKVGQYSVQEYHMLQIENYFNEMDTEGFTTEYSNLFNSLKTLKDDSAGLAARNSVIGYAQNIMEYFDVIKQNLVNQQEDINEEIKDKVDQINTLATDIAALNRQINTVELTGEAANDLRDRRALLIDDLSTIVEVSVTETTFENNKTEFKVMLGGMAIVDNYSTYQLKVETRDELKETTDAVGLYKIQWAWGEIFDPVANGHEGELKALIEMRDGNNQTGDQPIDYKGIPYYMAEINSFLQTFTDRFNEIHDEGYNLNGDKISDLNATGENYSFFIYENGKYQVNKKYIEDPMLFALSDEPIENGVENTGILDGLLGLQTERIYDGGQAGDFLQTLISEIAIDTRKATAMNTNYATLAESIDIQRMSISGVDKDEESMNLVKYQEAYELAAKIISIMTEVYDVLIRETGV